MSEADGGRDIDELILEGIVVTQSERGEPNIAPMGPRVDRGITWLVLRPFQTAQTYRNLKATGCGVFHVVDDVELLARAAVGQLDPLPRLAPVEAFACQRLVAVLEAAILATRIGILPADEITSELTRLAIPVQKTAGHQEREAFAFLTKYIESRLSPEC